MIEALIDSMRFAHLDPDAEEIVDILWLAAQMGASTFAYTEEFATRLAAEKQKTQQTEEQNRSHNQSQKSQTEDQNNPVQATAYTADLYLPDAKQDDTGGAGGLPFRGLGTPALSDTLRLARALRPLVRHIPSPTQKILNEEETVRQSADSGSLFPVLRPSPMRWLDLVLVVDESPSMILWRQTMAEFRLLLERLGAFRNVETWYIDSHTDDEHLYLYPSIKTLADKSDPRAPRQLLTSQGQRLILIASDCIGNAWHDGAAARMIQGWGKREIVGLVQLLPHRLWSRTALRQASSVYLRAHAPGIVNMHLEVELPSFRQPRKKTILGLPVPIMTLDADSLAAWARLIAGNSIWWSPGVILPTDINTGTTNPMRSSNNADELLLSPQQLIHRFRASASPQAQVLAGYLAAVPLSLPVMRLVQRVMLPESQQEQLSELLCSGLLKQTIPYKATLHSDDMRYEFIDGVRERLLDSLLVDDADRVLEVVFNAISGLVNTQTHKMLDFRAIVSDPSLVDQARMPVSGLPFARIAPGVLKRLGGNYTRLALHLERKSQAIPWARSVPDKVNWMTKNNEAFKALRTMFIALYDDPSSIRRIADDAGIDSTVIDFQGAVLDIWHRVLVEAARQKRLEALVKEAQWNYRENTSLMTAYQNYLLAEAADSVDPLQAADLSEQDSHIINADDPKIIQINTGGGLYIAGNVNAGGDFIGRDQQNQQKPDSELIESLREICEQTLSKLDNRYGRRILPLIQDWLDEVERTPSSLSSQPELKKLLKRVGDKVLDKFVLYAKNSLNAFKDPESQESKLFTRLRTLIDEGLRIDKEIESQFEDLEFVIAYLFESKSTIRHEFVDAELAGVYANLAWVEEANRTAIAQEITRLQQNAEDEFQIFHALIDGAVGCEQNFSLISPKSNTLVGEVADDYVTERKRKLHTEVYSWWMDTINVIDTVSQQKSQLYQWSQALKKQKAGRITILARIRTGLPFVRAFWPLETPTESSGILNDANYDFPSSIEAIFEQGVQPTYLLTTEENVTPNRNAISAADICDRYLSHPSHHVMTGQPQAGKTWLRLYLEHYASIIVEKVLPVFYFAPARMAFQTDELEIVSTLASSIANQLFASLLVRSSNRTTNRDPLRVSRIAIAQFLHRYGYNVPTGDMSLAQPLPADALLNIDQAYGGGYLSGLYAEMKQEIEQTRNRSIPLSSSSLESMLDDIHRAIELAGYRNIFLSVDNWDDLPNPTRHRLLLYMLNADLLVQLQQRNIFLKVFVPSIDSETLKHWQKTCEFDRLHNESKSRLVIYTYP